MRLLHLANHRSTNIGNGALVYGTEATLREDLGPDVAFDAEPWDDYTLLGTRRFDAAFVERVNRDYDGLIIGAAVTLNARSSFPNAGMRFDLPLALWDKFKKPVVFYGISHRVWPGQHYYHLDRLRATVRKALENPRVLFSVRNDDTADWLSGAVGVPAERFTRLPDPTLYVPIEAARHPQLEPGKVNLVLSLNNEDEVYRYGGTAQRRAWSLLGPVVEEKRLLRSWKRLPGWDRHRRRFLRRLARGVDALAQAVDLNIVLAAHTFDDFEIFHEFLALCSPRVGYQLCSAAGVYKMQHAPYFYGLYAQADLAVSMRVHAMNPAMGLGVPTVALSSQGRIDAFLEDAGLSEFRLDAFDPALNEKLPALAQKLLADRAGTRAKLLDMRRRMRARTAAFHKRMGALLKGAA